MTERRDPQVLLVNGGVTEEAYVLIEPNLSPTPISSSAQSKPRSSALSCTPRHLAILSIVCGFSCVGIKALLLAVKAENESDEKTCHHLSRSSRRWSVLSICLFLGTLISLPILLVLMSYILAVAE